MTSKEIRDKARSISIEIKRAAESGKERSENFRFKIDFLRDSILELASRSEFGYVAELATMSKHLLNQASLQNRATKFKLNVEDMLYMINTFPCAPDGVVNYISEDFTVNTQIAHAVVKSNSHFDTNFMCDNFLLMLRLAKLGDIDSWIELSKSTLENHSNADLVLRTFGEFETSQVENNKAQLQFLVEAISDFKAGHFPDSTIGEKVRYENLLYNLRAAGDVAATKSLLNVGENRYSDAFTLQRYVHDFDFRPDEGYRRNAARLATGSFTSPQQKHLLSSFFAYEMSTDEPLCQIDHTPNPMTLMSILALNGTESPYGEIKFNWEKVSELLDKTFTMALKDMNGDWGKVLKEYCGIDEKILMKSNIYKVRRLEHELGM